MKQIKCGVCGSEFEHGATICRGCQGEIHYGAGNLKWLFGIFYTIVMLFILQYLNSSEIQINQILATLMIIISFFIGTVHAISHYKDKVVITKRMYNLMC